MKKRKNVNTRRTPPNDNYWRERHRSFCLHSNHHNGGVNCVQDAGKLSKSLMEQFLRLKSLVNFNRVDSHVASHAQTIVIFTLKPGNFAGMRLLKVSRKKWSRGRDWIAWSKFRIRIYGNCTELSSSSISAKGRGNSRFPESIRVFQDFYPHPPPNPHQIFQFHQDSQHLTQQSKLLVWIFKTDLSNPSRKEPDFFFLNILICSGKFPG